MRNLLTAAGLTALLMTAPGAVAMAQSPTDPAQAAASAEADRLIATTGALEFFENVSADGIARVRHKASGLLCSFIPGDERNTLSLFGSPGVARGDDVGCQTNVGRVYMTYYATRYPGRVSAQDAADTAAEAMRGRYPDARPYEGPVATSTVVGATEQSAVRFAIMDGDVPSSTHSITVKIGDWIFKQRLTHADATAAAAQVVAQSSWTDVLNAALKSPGG